MLTEQEQQEIAREVAHAENAPAAAPEALKIVQRHRGWVNDEALADTAAALGMSPAELDSIATFYNLIYRRPVGRHVILLCDSVTCWITGYHGLREQLQARLGIALGQTTPDQRFTLLPTACLGACDRAPVMMIDEDLHTNLTPEMLDRILARYT